MTTAIYFFLMGICLFILPQLFVRYILGEPKMDKNIRFLIYAGILPVLWLFVPRELNEFRGVNFLQHMIGGGVAVGLVGIYFINSLKEKLPILEKLFLQFVLIYILVSAFGAANELLEFLLDYFGIGIFSADRYDTWFDILANTSGALLVFVAYKILGLFFKNSN